VETKPEADNGIAAALAAEAAAQGGPKTLALLGGTFDPLHVGHLHIAQAVYQQFGFTRIVFLPDYLPPHKQGQKSTPALERLEMARLALEPYPDFVVDDLEIRRGNISYTYDTVMGLKQAHPAYEIYLVIGGDSLEQLPTWYQSRRLVQEVKFVVAARPGYHPQIAKLEEFFGPGTGSRFLRAQTPMLDISSTDIRRRVREGESITGLVPPVVERYIYEHGLYR
jgi:nicotinate-nucleotide adenylyltransferase